MARTGGSGRPISETRLVRPALPASTFSIGGGTKKWLYEPKTIVPDANRYAAFTLGLMWDSEIMSLYRSNRRPKSTVRFGVACVLSCR